MKSKVLMTVAIIIITLLFLTNIVMLIRKVEYRSEIQVTSTGFNQKELLGDNDCPSATAGNNQSYFKAKYFFTDSCPWCYRQEKVIKELLRTQGHLFSVEWYNVAHCQEIADLHKVVGVPTFVFSTLVDEDVARYGYIPQDDFLTLICSVTGGC